MNNRSNTDAKSPPSPPAAAAIEVLQSVARIWIELWGIGSEDDFFESVIGPMSVDPALSGVDQSETLSSLMDSTEAELANMLKANLQNEAAWDNRPLPAHAKAKCVEYALFETTCTFAVQAVRVGVDEANVERQWQYACEAKRYLGMLQGYISALADPSAKSALAKRGADARHAENRAMKAQLFEWCAENLAKFKNLNAAAIAVSQTLLPIEFSTARSWIADWKKLQSASTP